MTSLAEGIMRALNLAQIGRTPANVKLDEYSSSAVSAVRKIITRNSMLAAIWGPPGTGKTTIYLKVFTEEYEKFGGGIVGVYVAPTNVLVTETFSRQIASLISTKYRDTYHFTAKDLYEILSQVRVYGSRICIGSKKEIDGLIKSGLIDCGDMRHDKCAEKIQEALRQVVYDPPTKELRWIFTTEWQDVIQKLKAATRGVISPTLGLRGLELGLFVDEASRSPIYRPFATIAQLLEARLAGRSSTAPRWLRELLESIDFYGLSVVGDDKQAIALHRYYHSRKGLLLLPAIHKVLENLNKCDKEWKGDSCAMLRLTKRIPEPSHKPISVGFYGNRLSATETADKRLAVLKDVAHYIEQEVSKYQGKHKLQKVLDKVAEAIYNASPIVVVNTKSFEVGDTFEPQRAILAAWIAKVLAEAIVHVKGDESAAIDIAVSGIYGDLVDSAQFEYLKRTPGEVRRRIRVRFATVHALLGDEADIHITMLGKEWPGRYWEDFDYMTMYYREPEIFNVQLSRHRRLLILIGDIITLKRRAKNIVLAEKRPSMELRSLALAAEEIYNLSKNYSTYVNVA